MLEKSNLKPRERIMMIIKNSAHRNITGEEILNSADIEDLSNNWKAKTSYLLKEYNKYWYMWDYFKYLEIDMQMLFNSVQLEIANFEKILLLYYYRENSSKFRKVIEDLYSQEDQQNALSLILKNTGLEHERTLHRYTFLSLSKLLQQDIIALDDMASWEFQYFNQEEKLSNILKNKKSLKRDEINELTNLIMDSLPWDRKDTVDEKRFNFSDLIFNSFFAGYSMIDFGKKLANKYDIDFKDESDLKKKLSKIIELRKKLKEIIHESITDGLFFEEYVPLCNSYDHQTYNGKTKLKHSEVLEMWIKEKNKVKKLIDDGGFIIEERTKNTFGLKLTTKIITGESLYYSDKNFSFIQDYKKQADTLSVYGYLFNLLKKENIPRKYGGMLAFQEIVSKVSEIVDTKVTKSDEYYVTKIYELSNQLNLYLQAINNQISDNIFLNTEVNFYIETFFEDFRINLENIKPVKFKPHKIFEKEVQKLLRSEWSTLK